MKYILMWMVFIHQTQKRFLLQKKLIKFHMRKCLSFHHLGAKVMQSSAVQTAMMYEFLLQVRSTFTERQGTKIF